MQRWFNFSDFKIVDEKINARKRPFVKCERPLYIGTNLNHYLLNAIVPFSYRRDITYYYNCCWSW